MNITLVEKPTYQPLGNRVLVITPRIDPDALVDRGGIKVHAEVDRRQNPVIEAPIVARGPDCSRHIEAGMFILFNANNEVPQAILDNEEYRFIPEERIIAIVNRPPAPPAID